MYTIYQDVSVRAIAATAPVRILDNRQHAQKTQDRHFKRQISYTGIFERHIATDGQRGSDLASIAAEKVMQHLQWERDSIHALIFVTQFPDLQRPSTAFLIQQKLGLSHDLMAFDVNLGCSGFTTGIQIMASVLSRTKGRGLLLLGDCHDYEPETEYSENMILFGDGGAAAALEYNENASPILCSQMADGSRYKALYSTLDGHRVMDGNEIVSFSLNEVVESIKSFFAYYHISLDTIDFCVLHQAQKIIVQGIADACAFPPEKILEAYQQYGNTTSASIPFALCTNVNRFSSKVLNIFTCGYGIGLAWSSAYFSIDSDCILPLEESDHRYTI